jgi:hypothetical protein
MTTVLYGVDGHYVNVTGVCHDINIANDRVEFLLPADDFERNALFGDPLPGVLKHIVLRQAGIADVQIPIGVSHVVRKLDPNFKRYRLAVATLFRDSVFYLREWIEFHLLVGVEHFYLGNNLSVDNYLPILQPYIDRGIVELVDVTDVPTRHFELDVHIPFMNRATHALRYNTEWLALIDVDEFITPVFEEPVAQSDYKNNIYNTLCELKRAKPNLGGVAVNWVCYGNSHIHKLSNDSFIMEKCTKRACLDNPVNKHQKCIVVPHRVIEYGIHNCVYTQECKTYDMSGQHVVSTSAYTQQPLVQRLRLTHYRMADEWYYRWTKIPFYADYYLSVSWTPGHWALLNDEYCKTDRYNDEIDMYMTQFAALLRDSGTLDMHHYDDDSAQDGAALRIVYGTHGHMRDVTAQVLKHCRTANSNTIVIEPGDMARSAIFGDPNPGVLKHVFVAHDSTMHIYSHNERIALKLR